MNIVKQDIQDMSSSPLEYEKGKAYYEEGHIEDVKVTQEEDYL